MKLDPTVMRTMNRQDFRVLAAVESGMKTHTLVPSPLIVSIANLRHGGAGKIISSLLRDKLLSHDRSCGYDGYRLTNSGYDILALHNLKSRGFVAALGDRIGTGKESDVYVAATSEGKQVVLKFHRLGRTSFRDVKKKRDYFMVNAVSKNKKRGLVATKSQPNSWLFLSRISALKEYSFMKALHEVEYPTPKPIAHNRHIVVMGLVRGMPLYQIHANRVSPPQALSIFEQSTELATRLAKHGLVHCDLNEYNLMVDLSGLQSVVAADDDVGEHYVRHSGLSVSTKGALSAHGPLQKMSLMDGTQETVTEKPPEPKALLGNGEPKPIVTLIDFPQMVSTRHPNAKELYERDVKCLQRFFDMKLKCTPEQGWDEWTPAWEDIANLAEEEDNDKINAATGGDDDEEASTCIASKAQLRLDEELKASGFSAEDASRNVELLYYTQLASHHEALTEEQEDESEEEQESSDDNQHSDDDEDSAAPQDQEGEKHEDNESLSSQEEKTSSRKQEHNRNEKITMRDVSVNMDDDMSAASMFSQKSWVVAEETAKMRVKKHMSELKKKQGRKTAFQTRNSNKTYAKGKRMYTEYA